MDDLHFHFGEQKAKYARQPLKRHRAIDLHELPTIMARLAPERLPAYSQRVGSINIPHEVDIVYLEPLSARERLETAFPIVEGWFSF